MKPLLKYFLAAAATASLIVAFLDRGPNFQLEWTREVPTKESSASLATAFEDTRNWPIFYHALKSVTLYENGKVVEGFDRVKPGMTAVFAIEPKGKEWKRFDIKAEVLAPKAGENLRFRMLEESTGKTTKLFDGFEWWIGLRPATEDEAKRGFTNFVTGGATAETKTSRARFFGRLSTKILMNQLYQVDLVRLANFTANKGTWAQDKATPVY